MSCNICADQLPEHEAITCDDDYRKGGISAYAVLECDHTITDFTDAAQWQANITSEKVKIVKRILGNVPAAAPVQGSSPVGCGPRQVLDNIDRSFIAQDFNVTADNNDFYDALNNRSMDGIVWFHCEESEISVVDGTRVDVQALDITPEDNGVKRQYQVTAAWRKKGMPQLFIAPAGIFE